MNLPTDFDFWLPHLISGGASFILMLIASPLLFRSKKTKQPPMPSADEIANQILQLPAFQQYVEDKANEKVNGLKSGMEKLLSQYLPKIGEQEKQIKALEAHQATAQKKIGSMPKINVDQIETLMNQFNERVKKVEALPKSQDGISIDPATFAQWIKQHPEVRQHIQEALNITVLQDTVTRVMPKTLQERELDELQQETLHRYWRLLNLKDEYIPKLKKEIERELKQEIIQHFTKR